MNKRRNFNPLPWHTHFTEKSTIRIDNESFNAYKIGKSGPHLLLLHGEGYCGLAWSLFAFHMNNYSECQIIAVDLRGHGETQTDENKTDLSLQTLSEDIKSIVSHFNLNGKSPLVLIGQGMGAALANYIVYEKFFENCCGLIVMSVYDGNALENLSKFKTAIKNRPLYFSSQDEAIEWYYRKKPLYNLESIQISLPSRLKPVNDKNLYVTNVDDSIPEEDEIGPSVPPKVLAKYTWRMDEKVCEKYWHNWYTNFSKTFVECDVPKVFLTSDINRLDKDLTIGRMQGKFEVHTIQDGGVVVQEEFPDRVAEIVASFLRRHKLASALKTFKFSNSIS